MHGGGGGEKRRRNKSRNRDDRPSSLQVGVLSRYVFRARLGGEKTQILPDSCPKTFIMNVTFSFKELRMTWEAMNPNQTTDPTDTDEHDMINYFGLLTDFNMLSILQKHIYVYDNCIWKYTCEKYIFNLNCNYLIWSYRIYLWLLSWIAFLWGQLWHLRELSEDAWSHVFPVKIRNRTGGNQTFLSSVHVPSHSDPPLLFLTFLQIHSRVDKSLWIYSCRESSCDSEYLRQSFLCTYNWNTILAFLSDEHIWCESSVLMV